MPFTQFWDEDPWLVVAYRKANDLRRQRTSEELWLQGLYNYNAVATAIGNAFRQKGQQSQHYLEEPIRLIPYSEQEQKIREEKEREKVIAYFNRLEKQWKETKALS